MNENMIFENSVQAEEESDSPVELTELFVQDKKTVTLLDTITVQAIICLLIGIAYIIVNIFLPQVSMDIYNTYNEQISSESNTATFSDAVQSFVDFINSTPDISHD